MGFVLLVALAVAYGFIVNLVRLLRCRFLLNKYSEYITENPPEGIGHHQDEIIGLFKKAGIKDSVVPHVQAIGFGQIQSGRVSVFNNITSSREDIVRPIFLAFQRADGIFFKRMLNWLNPLFWIEFVLNLPREALAFVGVPPEKALVKISLLVYWLIFGTGGLYAVFKPELIAAIRAKLGF